MKYKIGDRVKLINSNVEGVVVCLNKVETYYTHNVHIIELLEGDFGWSRGSNSRVIPIDYEPVGRNVFWSVTESPLELCDLPQYLIYN